jgi:2'-5' RNA ligase
MSKVNVFIAYMLKKNENQAFGRVAKEVRDVFCPNGKDELYFHTTLLFIGRVDDSYLPFIQEHLAKVAEETSPIQVDINRIAYFYNQKKQCLKVLYAVPGQIPVALSALCTKLYQTIGEPLIGKTIPAISPATIHFTISNRL